jgi:hypothetical protein
VSRHLRDLVSFDAHVDEAPRCHAKRERGGRHLLVPVQPVKREAPVGIYAPANCTMAQACEINIPIYDYWKHQGIGIAEAGRISRLGASKASVFGGIGRLRQPCQYEETISLAQSQAFDIKFFRGRGIFLHLLNKLLRHLPQRLARPAGAAFAPIVVRNVRAEPGCEFKLYTAERRKVVLYPGATERLDVICGT